MSSATLATAKRFYEIVANHGELSDILTQDCLWEIVPGFPYGGNYLGLDQIGCFFEKLMTHFEFWEAHPADFMDAGDDITVTGIYRTKAIKSGEKAELRFAHVWTVAGDKLIRLRHFADTVQLCKVLGHDVPTVPCPPITESTWSVAK